MSFNSLCWVHRRRTIHISRRSIKLSIPFVGFRLCNNRSVRWSGLLSIPFVGFVNSSVSVTTQRYLLSIPFVGFLWSQNPIWVSYNFPFQFPLLGSQHTNYTCELWWSKLSIPFVGFAETYSNHVFLTFLSIPFVGFFKLLQAYSKSIYQLSIPFVGFVSGFFTSHSYFLWVFQFPLLGSRLLL